jgi:hypothetical protein
VSKEVAYQSGATFSATSDCGYARVLACKHKTKLERLTRDKRSSLLSVGVSDEEEDKV